MDEIGFVFIEGAHFFVELGRVKVDQLRPRNVTGVVFLLRAHIEDNVRFCRAHFFEFLGIDIFHVGGNSAGTD